MESHITLQKPPMREEPSHPCVVIRLERVKPLGSMVDWLLSFSSGSVRISRANAVIEVASLVSNAVNLVIHTDG